MMLKSDQCELLFVFCLAGLLVLREKIIFKLIEVEIYKFLPQLSSSC